MMNYLFVSKIILTVSLTGKYNVCISNWRLASSMIWSADASFEYMDCSAWMAFADFELFAATIFETESNDSRIDKKWFSVATESEPVVVCPSANHASKFCIGCYASVGVHNAQHYEIFISNVWVWPMVALHSVGIQWIGFWQCDWALCHSEW